MKGQGLAGYGRRTQKVEDFCGYWAPVEPKAKLMGVAAFPLSDARILIESRTRPRGLLVVQRNLTSSVLAGFQATCWISPPATAQICTP